MAKKIPKKTKKPAVGKHGIPIALRCKGFKLARELMETKRRPTAEELHVLYSAMPKHQIIDMNKRAFDHFVKSDGAREEPRQ
jgi:hypothetical protein